MADKHFLDYDGLSQFFNGLKQKFYQKPSSGIPKTDLESAVRTSLGKADTALQSHQDISGKLDKSGGTMTGALNMGSKKITNLATPTNNTDAATKKYVDDKSHTHLNKEILDTIDMDSVRAWTTALPTSGGTMTGDLNMGSKKITSLATPTDNADAATKKYVDDACADYLPLAGGEMEDDLAMGGQYLWLTTAESPTSAAFKQDVTGVWLYKPAAIGGYADRYVELQGIYTPTGDYSAANKKYVDDQVSKTGHTHSNKTVLDGITSTKVTAWDAKASTSYVDNAISTAVASAVVYKGTKAAVANLPTTGNKTGDMWNVSADGMNYVWDGTQWDAQAPTYSITAITTAEIDGILASTT